MQREPIKVHRVHPSEVYSQGCVCAYPRFLHSCVSHMNSGGCLQEWVWIFCGVCPFTHKQCSRRLSPQTCSLQHRNLWSVQVRGGAAGRSRTQCITSAAEIMCFCLQHVWQQLLIKATSSHWASLPTSCLWAGGARCSTTAVAVASTADMLQGALLLLASYWPVTVIVCDLNSVMFQTVSCDIQYVRLS